MDLLETIAEQLHEGWWLYKKEQGVVYGPTRSATTHPHLLSWDDLKDVEAQNQDRFQAALILSAWWRNELTYDTLPAAIHNAWVIWEQLHKNNHPHAQPFAEAHPSDPQEHAVQARLIWRLLNK